MGRATKKPKCPLARDDQTSPSATPANACASLTSLPVEILAEVLLHTCSPPTVLAVSRTCSFLYHFLTQNSAASFIWRYVRKNFYLPVPDPDPYWGKSEADYAAFVFGEGICEVCRKTTRAMYASFAARIRLCGSWRCRKKLDETLIYATSMFEGRDRPTLWVPYVESNSSLLTPFFWPDNDILLRKTDLEKFQLEHAAYLTAQADPKHPAASGSLSVTLREEDERRKCIVERCRAKKQRLFEIMTLSTCLARWKYFLYDAIHEDIKKKNYLWTKNLAKDEGWDLSDLVASQSYGSLQRRKTLLFEKIGPNDVSPIRSAIEFELLAMKVRHKRQKAEATYRQKVIEVKEIYEHMRCGTLGGTHTGDAIPSDPPGAHIVPPLSVFYTLPSVRALKGSPDPSAVPPNSTSAMIEIKSSPLATSLIESDLHTWHVPVQKHLMSLLGYPNGWQSAGTRTLHPLKRVTARFFCRRCGEGEVGRRYQRERCLDLKGVCSHICARGKSIERRRQDAPQEADSGDRNKQGKRESRGKRKSGVKTLDWKVDVFVEDEKAIRLVKSILELTCLSEDDPSTTSNLSAKGGVIRCMSCKGWIVMDFDTAIGHAHRHESMQIQLLATAASQIASPNKDTSTSYGHTGRAIPGSRLVFERGMSEFLLGPSHSAHNLCKKVNYGCRHCFLGSQQNVAIGIEKSNVGKGVRALDFNGLRSHVKAKHGIHDIHDEDFFCYSSIQNDGGETWQG